MAEAASQSVEVTAETREQISAIQAKGAKMAFMVLPDAVQRTYTEVAITELAAFVHWRKSQVALQEKGEIPPATEFEGGWDLLNIEEKSEWLPENPRAFLAADAQWVALLAEHPLREPGAKPSVPIKGEASKSAPVKQQAVVKKELKQDPPAKVQKQEAPKEKAVVKQEPTKPKNGTEAPKKAVVKQEPKQSEPAKTAPKQEAPKGKAKQTEKQEAPKEKASIKQEPKSKVPVPATGPDKVEKEAPKENAQAVKHESTESVKESKRKEKPKARENSKAKPGKPKAQPKAPKAKAKVIKAAPKTSLEQRLKKKSARQNREAEDDHLMALVPRSEDEPEEAPEPDVAEQAPLQAADPGAPAPRGRAPRAARAPRAPRARRAPVNQGPSHRVKAVAANLFPEALEATCCKCSGGTVEDGNDLGMCDRCDKAFHQKCHDPCVRYFGHPDDQWFCAQCTLDLAQMRQLKLQVEEFCWVQAAGETMPWPAQVLRIDFSSLADPKPYWVQYFDAGPPEGAWVGDTHVKCWSEGPGFMSIAQTKRRNAVRLAEAAGAPTVSIDRLPIGGSQPAARKRPRTEMEAEAPRKRAPGGAGDEEQQVRRSRRGEANVTLLTELKPRPRAGARLESPEVRKQLPADVEGPPSTEKQPRGERQANVDETKNLVAQLKEQQRRVEEAVAQQEAAS